MTLNLLRKTLQDDRRALLGWALGLAAFIGLYVGFYPQFKNQVAATKLASLPESMRDFLGVHEVDSAAGYLEMTVFTLTGPLLMIMVAVVLGTRAVAGLEESHGIELILANPISRQRFLVERFAAFALEVIGLAMVPWLLMLVLAKTLDMDISAGQITATCLSLLTMALAFGTLAMAVGAITGRRPIAMAVAGGAAVASYALHGLASQISALNGLRWLSLFQYYLGDDPLRTGFHLLPVLVPGLLTVLLVLGAGAGFNRRDLAA